MPCGCAGKKGSKAKAVANKIQQKGKGVKRK